MSHWGGFSRALLTSSAFIILHSAFFDHWARLIASRRADDFKETALLPDFLADIFCGLLGYTGPVGPADPHNSHLSGTGPAESPDTFTLSRARRVEVHDKVADAVLGRFQKHKEQFVMGPMPA